MHNEPHLTGRRGANQVSILTRAELFGRSLARKYFPHQPVQSLDYDPYDKEACEHRANKLLNKFHRLPKRGAYEACQGILAIIGESYPTEKLTAEYFFNLENLLSSKSGLENPGQLLIGLGSGRCGSTSLAAMLATVTNSCSTHETPPLIFWQPELEQIDFHIKRFRILTNYFSLVADVSHWWLNSIERVFDAFPGAKAIGLVRDNEDCARSFSRIQGFGVGSYNPWAATGNGLWRTGHWDPTYPTYSLPSYAQKKPDRAKFELIGRYVSDYNAQLAQMAVREPKRVKLVRTEELGRDTVQKEIFRFANGQGQTSTIRLNVKDTTEGIKLQIKF